LSINLVQLNDLKNKGHYLDYKLAEYQALKFFIEQIELYDDIEKINIMVVGGNTNLDLFYATQNIKYPYSIFNFDNNGESDRFQIVYDQYKRMFDFKGEYKHLKLDVLNFNSAFNVLNLGNGPRKVPLCLMLNAHQDGLYELVDQNVFPKYTIVSHYGKYKFVEGIINYTKNNNLILMSDNLAFFSNIKKPNQFNFLDSDLNTVKRNWFDNQNVEWII